MALVTYLSTVTLLGFQIGDGLNVQPGGLFDVAQSLVGVVFPPAEITTAANLGEISTTTTPVVTACCKLNPKKESETFCGLELWPRRELSGLVSTKSQSS